MSSTIKTRAPASPFWNSIYTNVWWMLTQLPWGEEYAEWLQIRHPINLHKGLSLIVGLLCMSITGTWTYAACVYTAAHGTYGISWLLKEWLYRDASWESPSTLSSAIGVFVGMAIVFWCNIFMLTTSGGQYDPTPGQLCIILCFYIIGMWLHHTSDAQKYFVLRARKGLISDGMFSRCRNPNYLGEIFIYGSFAAFTINHPRWWFSWVGLSSVWLGLFVPSWLAKDNSMSRYPQWSQYVSHTGLFYPWPLGSAEIKESKEN